MIICFLEMILKLLRTLFILFDMSVQIFDNFLSKDEFDILTNEISKPKYEWGHVSNSYSEYEYPWLKMSLTDIPFFNTIMKSKIENTVNMTFDIERIYMNGQPYGAVSGFHTDSTDTNAYTFLLFVHDCYKTHVDHMGGYFYYKLNDEIRCIEPIKNRAIIFNSNIVHKGNAFNMGIKVLRQSVAWKLYRNSNNKLNDNTITQNNNSTISSIADNSFTQDELLSLFKNSKYIHGIEQFKPIISLLNTPDIINCERPIIISFENAIDKENTISNLLSRL
jgi:hypothetical protein